MEASAQGYQRYKVLWPLAPAMAMVMIDFTIVSISATTIQRDVHLSETGEQWLVTAYALATAAFVALGGTSGPGCSRQAGSSASCSCPGGPGRTSSSSRVAARSAYE